MLSSGGGWSARVVGTSFLLAALAGCSNEPPGCADEKTVALVKETFWESVAKVAAVNPSDKYSLAMVRPKFELALLSPRVTDKQANAAKVFCEASLHVARTDPAAKGGDKYSREVEYSSQITADGKEHYVELRGHQDAVKYVWGLAQMGALGPTPGAAVAPVAAPAAVASTPAVPAAAAPSESARGVATQPGVGSATSTSAPPVNAAGEFEAADKDLNEAYRLARDSMSDAQKTVLRDEQRLWIKQRDESCSEQRIAAQTKGAVAGGTAMESEQLACKAKMTAERAGQLRALRK